MSVGTAYARVTVGGGAFHACTESQVVTAVREAIQRGEGGRIITPNVDILRQARRDALVYEYLADASFVVADGMPLIWASRLAGTPLPERVCGSSLIWSLSAGLGQDGRSVYLLGGEPADPPRPAGPARSDNPARSDAARADNVAQSADAAADAYAAGFADAAAALAGTRDALAGTQDALGGTRDVPRVGVEAIPRQTAQAARYDGAWHAAERLVAASPGLRVAGWHSPEYGFERDPATLTTVCRSIVDTRPDLVFVGLGFPKQEWLISRLRAELPATWFLGCGAAVNFVAGEQRRAPGWMRRTGLEWTHRLVSEPRRLAARYLRHDAPYAVRLLAGACATRLRRRSVPSGPRS